MLNAKTIITGAKIEAKIFSKVKFFPMLSAIFQRFFLKIVNRIKNGDQTITTRKNPTLIINTPANATKGKNNAIATSILIIICVVIVPNHELVSISESSVKFNNEAYIVINGQTNHFDLSINCEKVVAIASF
jgi:hypothetical protein